MSEEKLSREDILIERANNAGYKIIQAGGGVFPSGYIIGKDGVKTYHRNQKALREFLDQIPQCQLAPAKEPDKVKQK